jgi:hypothetical protein
MFGMPDSRPPGYHLQLQFHAHRATAVKRFMDQAERFRPNQDRNISFAWVIQVFETRMTAASWFMYLPPACLTVWCRRMQVFSPRGIVELLESVGAMLENGYGF